MQSQQAGAGPCLTLVPRVVPDLQMYPPGISMAVQLNLKFQGLDYPQACFQLPEHVEHIPISTQFQVLKRMNRHPGTRAPGHPVTATLRTFPRRRPPPVAPSAASTVPLRLAPAPAWQQPLQPPPPRRPSRPRSSPARDPVFNTSTNTIQHIYTSVCVISHISIYTYSILIFLRLYIYIYRERERARESVCVCAYMYLSIIISVYVYMVPSSVSPPPPMGWVPR
jgi:hypothetical protein